MILRRPLKLLLWLSAITLLLVLTAVAGLWWLISGSQAQLDGSVPSQVSAKTVIKRDAQGIVTLTGETRDDIAYALGFVHAQERFFQMDLLRRNSAGELSELFGELAVDFDADIRIHQFRARAEVALSQLAPQKLALLEAYTKGVNAGLGELRTKPFEYYLLQTTPTNWQPADSLLVVYSMYMDLQDEWGETERSISALYDLLPNDWFNFLMPEGGEWDATLDGGDMVYQSTFPEQPLSSFQAADLASNTPIQYSAALPGSNNWSVKGLHTATGSAMVADDMHLGLSVPNIWFRASWLLPNSTRHITGATLPGTPLMIVGSTEKIAWGFTNAYGDFSDIIRLQTNADKSEYLTPEGWQPFRVTSEMINVKGQPSQQTLIKTTRWGPVIGEDHFGQLLVLHWVAHEEAGVNLNLLDLEQAESVTQALDIATHVAIPGQNFNVADANGDIGWTIMGLIPDRVGYRSELEKHLPSDWSTGARYWQGTLDSNTYPKIQNMERLWTANARIVSDENLTKIGDGFGALGARQQQIRDHLFASDQFSEADFLAIQLDDEARFLERWQTLMLLTLSEDSLAGDPVVEELKQYVSNWGGHASTGSVGYLLVKRFREEVIDQTIGHVYRHIENMTLEFWPESINSRIEYPVWKLITEQPERHIPASYASWNLFLRAQALTVYRQYLQPNTGLAEQTWGAHNRLSIKHPMSDALPLLSTWLDMPSVPMPGDTFMPRVQTPDFGASQRMAVSPGHEDKGYFHMATGQSGHPLSPFYRAGHEDWVTGRASPFLPGPTQYELTLEPNK